MVRSFLLNDEQREAIDDYFENRPRAMTQTVRQIRLRAKKLDFKAMLEDIVLLEKLAKLRLPRGRKSADVLASFTIGKSKYDPIIDRFLKGEDDLVEVAGTNKSMINLRAQLKSRVEVRDLQSKIKISVRSDSVYLEKIKVEEKK